MPQSRGYAERRVEPEWLDQPGRHDPQRNLRDLERLNRWFGGHAALLARLGEIVERDEPFRVLDVGAATGDMGAAVRARYPRASVLNLDRRFAHLARRGAACVAADAFQLPFAGRSFDIVMANLFLHHFTEREITTLLASFAACARRAVVIVDLLRHPLAGAFLPLTRPLLGWDPMTVHDGVISVRAAFRPHELEALARRAQLRDPRLRVHHPWFRLSLVAAV
jgi:2-polyprenyl-3-methyl-5-hydroxy-6-metoxy-1,4-benzoquinol methylase